MSLDDRIDELCDQFEKDWKEGAAPSIEKALVGFSAEEQLAVLHQLIPVDIECRRSLGQPSNAADYKSFGSIALLIAEAAVRKLDEARSQLDDTDDFPTPRSQNIVSSLSQTFAEDQRTESQILDSFQRTTRSDEPSPTIGPYQVLQKIDSGGMGIVFMAEQTHPVRRRVALKLIKAGMDTRDVITRFEAERQALALMDHPNIAKVLDAGATRDGRPYFVMELVDGIPVTEYCDKHKLSIEDRLELFTQTCRAIQHAHQKGIIHRDIKPSNVLVAQHDGIPSVKVIDFGLAKALQAATRLTDKTMFTEFGQVVGTFQYMSPEQAESSALDIDTRSDVYSLGVLLYELLTGSTPIEKQRLKEMARERILMAIREEEAPRPSLRLSSLGDSATGISEQRRTDPKRLGGMLKGDLDWITVKAIEKDRSRRYESAAQFADDVCRFRNSEPIVARPPSYLYRLSKFIRRNRVRTATTAITVFLMSLTAVAIVMAWAKSVELSQERETAIKGGEERSKLEVEQYFSNVALAAARQREGSIAEAAKLMEDTSPELRNWEYEYLQRTIDQSLEVVDLPLRDVAAVVQSGNDLLIVSSNLEAVRTNDLHELNARPIRTELSRCDCAAVSPSGRILAMASYDSEVVTVHDLTKNASIGNFKIEEEVTSLAVIDDETVVAGDQRGDIHLVDVLSGAVETHSLGDLWVTNLTPVPSKECLVMNLHSQLICWHCPSKQTRWTTELTGQVDAPLVISESLSKVFVATDAEDLLTADLETGDVSLKVERRTAPRAMCLTNDDQTLLLANEDGRIAILEASSLQETGRRDGHVGSIRALIPGPRDREFLSFGEDAVCRVWSLDFRGDHLEIDGHSSSVTSITFSPAGSVLATGGHDSTVLLWDLANDPPTKAIAELPGHSNVVFNMLFAKDGRVLFSADGDGHLFAWDVMAQKRIDEFIGHNATIYGLALSPDGKTLASGDHLGTIHIRDLANWKAGVHCESRKITSDPVCALRFSADGGQLISIHGNSELKVWDTTNWNVVKSIKISSLSYAVSNELSSGMYILGGKPLGIFEHVDVLAGLSSLGHRLHTEQIYGFASTTDRSRLFSASRDHSICVFSVPENRQVLSLIQTESETPASISFSDKDRLLGAGYMHGKISIWGDLRPFLKKNSRRFAFGSSHAP